MHIKTRTQVPQNKLIANLLKQMNLDSIDIELNSAAKWSILIWQVEPPWKGFDVAGFFLPHQQIGSLNSRLVGSISKLYIYVLKIVEI